MYFKVTAHANSTCVCVWELSGHILVCLRLTSQKIIHIHIMERASGGTHVRLLISTSIMLKSYGSCLEIMLHVNHATLYLQFEKVQSDLCLLRAPMTMDLKVLSKLRANMRFWEWLRKSALAFHK